MAAMIAAARRPLPPPEIGAAAAFGFAELEPVVNVPPVVEETVLIVDCMVGEPVLVIVLESLFGISKE
jgi:hypothetical protein